MPTQQSIVCLGQLRHAVSGSPQAGAFAMTAKMTRHDLKTTNKLPNPYRSGDYFFL